MSSEEVPRCLGDLNKALNVLVCVKNGSNSSTNTPKPPESVELNFNECGTAPVAEEICYNVSNSPLSTPGGSHYKENEISTVMGDFWRVVKNESHFKLPKEMRSKCCLQTCTCSSCSAMVKKQKTATQSTEIRIKHVCSPTTTREPKKHNCAAATSSSALPKASSYLSKKEIKSRMFVESCTGSSCSGTKRLKSPTPSAGGRSKTIFVPIIRETKKDNCCSAARKTLPLSKALSNLNDAATFEKDCAARVSELLSTQQSLTEQVQFLEEKEKNGVELLKKADCMWSSMEDQYKKQLDEKKEIYKTLLKEKKELETNISKWRKTQKDLEFQIKNLDNNSQEITVKTIQRGNDIKVLKMEIESYKKRIMTNANDLEAAKNSYDSKKRASEARLKKMAEEMQRIQERVTDECQCKEDKEHEGTTYLKEARDDLQKICRCLLQKKLENEDLRAEKDALIQEIDLLKATSDTCSERCARREKNIAEETKRIDKEIADYQVKCIQCHKFTDSVDLTGYCIDCPRCVIKRECMIKGDKCSTDHTKDCVCTRVKQKFLDNVFENMYSVLEKQANTCTGKEVADCVFTCLERSRNGKLDENTRSILQEFILSTVKKNLNLTIVGGAVKTRCELDPEMYRQLMLCLKDVTVPKPLKADKGIAPRKPPCSRWNETTECNCPRGPKNCPCIKKAPKPPVEPESCGQPYGDEIEGSLTTIHAPVHLTRQPCAEESCMTGIYGTNMRAAQCILGPDALAKVRTHSKRPTQPTIPIATFTNTTATCIIGNKAKKSCNTDTDITEYDLSKISLINSY